MRRVIIPGRYIRPRGGHEWDFFWRDAASIVAPGLFGYRQWWDYARHEMISSATPPLSFSASPIGRAVNFDGSDPFIQSNAAPVAGGADELTAFAYIRRNGTARHIFMWEGDVLGNGGGDEDEWHLGGGTTFGDSLADEMHFFMEGGVDAEDIRLATPGLADLTYHALCATVRGITSGAPAGELFLDGVSVATDGATSALSIGNYDTAIRYCRPGVNSRRLDGDFVMGGAWTRAWSATEVRRLSANPLGPFAPAGVPYIGAPPIQRQRPVTVISEGNWRGVGAGID